MGVKASEWHLLQYLDKQMANAKSTPLKSLEKDLICSFWVHHLQTNIKNSNIFSLQYFQFRKRTNQSPFSMQFYVDSAYNLPKTSVGIV